MAFHFERKLDPCFFRHKTFYEIFVVFQNFWKISTCNLLKGHKLTILFHGSQFPLLMFLFALGFCQSKFFFYTAFSPSGWTCLSFTFFAFFPCASPRKTPCFFILFFTFSHYFFWKKNFKLLLILFIYSSRPHHVVCKILVPWSGMKPMPPALKAEF